MLCFRDTTFCASNCVNSACPRHFGEDDRAAADRWWREFMRDKDVDNGAPIAWADFSGECERYKPTDGE